MLGEIIKDFVDLLLGGEVKHSVLAIVEEVMDSNIGKSIQKVHFCACMDEFLVVQGNEQLVQQLQEIITKIKTEFRKQIENGNLNIIEETRIYLDTEFKTLEIPVDERNPLKENLIQYIEYYIQKTDDVFFRDILLQEKINGNETELQHLRMHVRELEETIKNVEKELQNIHLQPVIQGTKKLDIKNDEKLAARQNEIDRIEQMFQNQRNVVFLYGRPGMGKSTLAKLYANKFCKDQHGRVVYFMHYYNSIEETITEISADVQKYDGKDILKYWESMAPAEREKILLVIDNFNEDTLQGVNRNSFINEIIGEYFKTLKNLGIRILFTTRIRVEETVFEVLPVENTFGLFEGYVSGGIKDGHRELVERIIEVLHKNTLLIVLAAHLWEKSNDEEKWQILDKIKNRNIEGLEDELTAEIDVQSEDWTIYGQVSALLDFSGVLDNEDVRKVLINAALLPLVGMSKGKFLELIGRRYKNSLNDLIINSWVLEESGMIALHPVIREIIIKRKIVLYKECQIYCEKLKNYIEINRRLEERLPYRNYAWEVFDLFWNEKEMDAVLAELFYNLSDIYDELAERERALRLVDIVYRNINVFNNDLLQKAELLSGIAYSMNNKYENMEDLEKAEKLLNEAECIMPNVEVTSENRVRYVRLTGKIISNLGSNNISKGRCNQMKSKEYFEKAREYHEKALNYRIKQLELFALNDMVTKEMERFVATSYTNVATTYFYLKDYENAIGNHQKACQMRESFGAEKAMNDNQQRIIGCVIQIYRRDLEVDENYLKMALEYYPRLLQCNYQFGVNKALETNLVYFKQLSKIIMTNRKYEGLIETVKEKKRLIQKWIESDDVLMRNIEIQEYCECTE